MQSKIFTNSNLELFRESGKKEFQIFDNSQITDPQFISNQQNTMDMFHPMKLDIGITKLIDEICAGEINTPDISVFDEFCSQKDLELDEGFPWEDSSLTGKSISDKSTLNNSHCKLQDLFTLSPSSPSLYENDSYKDEQILTSPEKGEEDVTTGIEKVLSSDKSNENDTLRSNYSQDHKHASYDSENLPFIYANQNLTVKSNMTLPHVTDFDEPTITSCTNTFNQQDNTQEFYLSSSNILKEPIIQENNYMPVVKQELLDFASLCNYDTSDLVTIDQRSIEDINAEVAVNSTSNILLDAIQGEEIDEETISNSKEIQEKIDSFLNFSSTPLLPNSHIECPSTFFTPNFATASQKDILNSFKLSPFGKKCGNAAVLKNVKIIVPSEHTKHFTVTPSNQKNNAVKSHFIIQSREDLSKKNEDSSLYKNIASTNAAITANPVAITISDDSNEISSSSGIVTSINRKRTIRASDKNSSNTFSTCDSRTKENIKRSKLSLKGMDDAEKYRRIREQNNIASKKCRERMKKSIKEIAIEIDTLTTDNALLRKEWEQLEFKVSKWKHLWRSITTESASMS